MKFLECDKEIKYLKSLISNKISCIDFKIKMIYDSVDDYLNVFIDQIKNKEQITDPMELSKYLREKYGFSLQEYSVIMSSINLKNNQTKQQINLQKNTKKYNEKYSFCIEIEKELSKKHDDKSDYYDFYEYSKKLTLNYMYLLREQQKSDIELMKHFFSGNMFQAKYNKKNLSTQRQFRIIKEGIKSELTKTDIKQFKKYKSEINKLKDIKNELSLLEIDNSSYVYSLYIQEELYNKFITEYIFNFDDLSTKDIISSFNAVNTLILFSVECDSIADLTEEYFDTVYYKSLSESLFHMSQVDFNISTKFIYTLFNVIYKNKGTLKQELIINYLKKEKNDISKINKVKELFQNYSVANTIDNF
jgi:hypothetical protein